MSSLSSLSSILPLLLAAGGQTGAARSQSSSMASSLLGGGSRGVDPLTLLIALGGIPTGSSSTGSTGGAGSLLGGDLKKLLPLLLLSGAGGAGGSQSLILLLLLLKNAKPAAPSLYTSFGVNLEDANKVLDAASKDANGTVNAEGATKAELDAYIAKNSATTKEGKIARFFRGLFDLVAFQKGNIYRMGKEDLIPFAKLDGKDAKVITATEIAGEVVTPAQAKKIQDYIKNNQDKLNEVGDKKDTVYAGNSKPTLTTSGNTKLVLVGPNGDQGIFDPVAYFIAKNRDWKTKVGA